MNAVGSDLKSLANRPQRSVCATPTVDCFKIAAKRSSLARSSAAIARHSVLSRAIVAAPISAPCRSSSAETRSATSRRLAVLQLADDIELADASPRCTDERLVENVLQNDDAPLEVGSSRPARPITTASRQFRQRYGYSPYNPGVLAQLLGIYRVFYNYVSIGRDKMTPAMRLGLTEAPVHGPRSGILHVLIGSDAAVRATAEGALFVESERLQGNR
jgi:hypothetical protein